jgi:hypothetical protein
MTLHTQTEGSPPSRGSDLAPYVILIIGIEQGAKLEPNEFDKFGTGNAVETTFPFKIMQGRCILCLRFFRGCALISRTDGSGDHYAKCKDEDLVPSIESFLQSRESRVSRAPSEGR